MGVLTREEFEKEALSLVTSLQRQRRTRVRTPEPASERKRNDRRETSLAEFPDWIAEGGRPATGGGRHGRDNAELYLAHPPVVLPFNTALKPHGDSNERDDPYLSEGESFGLEEDPDGCIATDGEDSASAARTDSNAAPPLLAEWAFSICYSDTWGVPVLYFRANFMDGRRCPREDILETLDFDEMQEGDGWDFISEEEHPVTGDPSYFLHPCQSSARLKLLLGDRLECGGVSGQILLSWLAMVLPAVRCQLSATGFTELRSYMESVNSKSVTFFMDA